MPPRLFRAGIGLRSAWNPISPRYKYKCFFCSLSRYLRPTTPSRKSRIPKLQQNKIRVRQQSNTPTISTEDNISKSQSQSPRIELRDALIGLQKEAGNYVNISRLQLAIRGLDQEPGKEIVRIAILGIDDGGTSVKNAKELLRLLVADPLKTEEEWEHSLVNDSSNKPLVLRIGQDEPEENIHGSGLVQELSVSSPLLNKYRLEVLLLETSLPQTSGADNFTDFVLVPTMDIPTSSTGRYTPVTTPVHKALIISEGILGAASAMNYSRDNSDTIRVAVDLHVAISLEKPSLPFQVVNIALGSEALQSFRQSVDNALLYEKSWFESGIPEVQEWLKEGSTSTDGSLKPILRQLIQSVIEKTAAALEEAKAKKLTDALSSRIASPKLENLHQGLSAWAENAHTELRDQLDIAFNGQRWRKLGWWKLFWRVDDVSMIASDILNQRFLTDAEKQIIFLTGQISQSGVLDELKELPPMDWAYKPVVEEEAERIEAVAETVAKPWPLQITDTRLLLSQDTIPALQALAQKLVLQTLTTSSFSSIFGGLIYVSSLSTSMYEAGAVAALGTVWSLRRMQGKWETARKFWEGEVREEGRKAVREVEGVVGKVLTISNKPVEPDTEIVKAAEVVARAETALAACK